MVEFSYRFHLTNIIPGISSCHNINIPTATDNINIPSTSKYITIAFKQRSAVKFVLILTNVKYKIKGKNQVSLLISIIK